MPRRREVPKRTIIPDPKFKDKLVAKFTNSLMIGGKKATAEGILYGAFDIITGALQGRADRGLPQGARQREAEARGEEPPRRRRDLPGPGRGSARAPRRPRHALARHVLARPRREDDARAPRGRVRRRRAEPRQRGEEEGRHAQDGRGQQGVRPLPLVTATRGRLERSRRGSLETDRDALSGCRVTRRIGFVT